MILHINLVPACMQLFQVNVSNCKNPVNSACFSTFEPVFVPPVLFPCTMYHSMLKIKF